jgi:hypothetical protein
MCYVSGRLESFGSEANTTAWNIADDVRQRKGSYALIPDHIMITGKIINTVGNDPDSMGRHRCRNLVLLYDLHRKRQSSMSSLSPTAGSSSWIFQKEMWFWKSVSTIRAPLIISMFKRMLQWTGKCTSRVRPKHPEMWVALKDWVLLHVSRCLCSRNSPSMAL